MNQVSKKNYSKSLLGNKAEDLFIILKGTALLIRFNKTKFL